VAIRFEPQDFYRTKARDLHVFDPVLLDILATHQEERAEPDLAQEQAALDECLQEASDPAARDRYLEAVKTDTLLGEIAGRRETFVRATPETARRRSARMVKGRIPTA